MRRDVVFGRNLGCAAASPATQAAAIERHRGPLRPIIVPWMSDEVTLGMTVTLVKSDGRAMDQSNLGTMTLSNLGRHQTRVPVVARSTDHPEERRLTPLLDTFGRQRQDRCQARVGRTDRAS